MNDITEQLTMLYATPGAFDPTALAISLAPNVTLHVPGAHPLSGDHRGPAGVASFVHRSRESTNGGEHLELIDVLSSTTHVGAYLRVTAQRDGRDPLVNHTIHLYRIGDDDRISEIWFHNREQAPVDAFWS